MDRRSFFRVAGGAALAAAPLFIPAHRLEMGVPRKILTPELPVGYLVHEQTGLSIPLRPPVYFVTGDTGLKKTTEVVWEKRSSGVVPIIRYTVPYQDSDLWGSDESG